MTAKRILEQISDIVCGEEIVHNNRKVIIVTETQVMKLWTDFIQLCNEQVQTLDRDKLAI